MKLSEFLKENKMYAPFMRKCEECGESGIASIASSFEWSNEKECGPNRWSKLDDKWNRIKNQEYDIIFKETK